MNALKTKVHNLHWLTEYDLDVQELVPKLGTVEMEKKLDVVLEYAVNRISIDNPKWSYVASRAYLLKLYSEVERNRGIGRNYADGDFYLLVKQLSYQGVYSNQLLDSYTEQELVEISNVIQEELDKKFTHIGAFLLSDRYLAKDTNNQIVELPQERFMMIALLLMKEEERSKRLELVKEAYWALSNQYMTVATPTLANAGKRSGQLSSCFIDTMDDSLDSIYLTNHDAARVSKAGGGVGIYMGKVRALGSAIQGVKGSSSGIIPWIKLLNNTAVSVDQLGQRQGAIAVYIDIFHKDIMNGFLELKTNNGDERRKAHDIFTGVCVPDLFMRKLEEVDSNGRSIGEWSVFCPYEVKQLMGWKDELGNALGLEDFYDEEDQQLFTEKYHEALNHPLLPRLTYRAMDIMTRVMIAQLETGTPYMFYRDEVNRQNPNKHVRGKGRTAIYCSNLCTEIMQNMSSTIVVNEEMKEEQFITQTREAGDYVVCNLSSLHLPNAVESNELERIISIQVRMLDNVIDINNLPLMQASRTNKKYRAIGLGTFGWHHLLATKHIYWESEEAVEYASQLYEEIAYHTIRASMKLSKEKGTYPLFRGSDWENGNYFTRKNYSSNRWQTLKEDVNKYGLRNGWLMAVAPNSSTAKIGGSTDGIDPLFAVEYVEEKKNFRFGVTAPDLTHKTYEFYRKTRDKLDQHWSIEQNAARQRHIDQSISFNLYVRHDIKAKELLSLHLHAWKSKLKSTYYVRSTSQSELEACTVCES
ncbi:ribonucleoside-diphosphate reductase subunit alpha [Mangrovibacillus cuniculi]|uniref:Ribonucleoside-diphosphate reductase n=1 Tax=Mangrovibacillus cuniculi TaxID=2593652 RepID=A0A7S8CD33_9BACI|nr:ribonucleoside-diphosphate reductase subunit alpha [Mangrovibacillus cuniculi]QPC47621.1 ribonucleoside-diphosphate reductase subunit alpha [Mangrovibacillus cuniculi]